MCKQSIEAKKEFAKQNQIARSKTFTKRKLAAKEKAFRKRKVANTRWAKTCFFLKKGVESQKLPIMGKLQNRALSKKQVSPNHG